MKKFILLFFTLLLSLPLLAQLEVKEGSFKEVPGFVNINTEKMYDDNDKPYAVLKIKTENISSKERHELSFKGDAQTFFEVEYKDGEVWLYISYYASYIKISHEEFSSTEFHFPFDMKPKCGYELTIVNKSAPISNGWASLTITTSPENGAEITINGRELDAITPHTNNMLPPGKYEILVTKEGFQPVSQTIELQENESKSIEIYMPYDYGQDFDASNQTFTVNGVTFEMILVKGGTFTMGCTSEQGEDCNGDEKPTHRVTLSDYYIGKFEVTQELWQAVMGDNPSSFRGTNLPVERVSWNDIQEFIKKLNQQTGVNFRLPTEAEWEFAAKGGNKSKGYKYSGSNNADEVAWYTTTTNHSRTKSVGIKLPNELGIYDMSGNVWEWCQDRYGNYSNENQTNPTGPSLGSHRVLRGGSWSDYAMCCRVSYRHDYNPGYRNIYYGFRLALSEP